MALKATFSHGSPVMEDHTPGADVLGGDVVVVGSELHICHNAIPANRLGALGIRNGVYSIAKATGNGTAIAKGTVIYGDVTNGVAATTANSGANKKLGVTCDFDTADADTLVNFIHVPS